MALLKFSPAVFRALCGLLGFALVASQPARCAPGSVFVEIPAIAPEERSYAEGRAIWIYRPDQKAGAASSGAALVFVHGGGWSSGKASLYDLHCRYFASRGYVCFSVDYRLTSQDGVTIFDCMSDVRDAIRWVRTHAAELGVDASRIAAIGDSAGGHLVAASALIPGSEPSGGDMGISSRPDAMILIYPILDTTPPDGWDLPRMSGAAGRVVADRAEEISPIDHVKPGAPPALVLSGTEDALTPVADSRRFVGEMRRAGNEISHAEFPGEKHAFITPGYGSEEAILAALKRMEEFLKEQAFQPGSPPKT